MNDSAIHSQGRFSFSLLVTLVNLGFIFYSVFDVYVKLLKVFRLKLEKDHVPIRDEEIHVKLMAMWVQHQCLQLASKVKEKFTQ